YTYTLSLHDALPISFIKNYARKISKQVVKDYVVFPALAGPFAPKVLVGNALANIGRSVWASSVIFCGHFTEQAQTFTEEECENRSEEHTSELQSREK